MEKQKNIFEVFKEMNEDDEMNSTAHLSVSPYFEAADKTKRGGVVKMGVDENTFWDIINQKKMCILLCIDREEYEKRKANL